MTESKTVKVEADFLMFFGDFGSGEGRDECGPCLVCPCKCQCCLNCTHHVFRGKEASMQALYPYVSEAGTRNVLVSVLRNAGHLGIAELTLALEQVANDTRGTCGQWLCNCCTCSTVVCFGIPCIICWMWSRKCVVSSFKKSCLERIYNPQGINFVSWKRYKRNADGSPPGCCEANCWSEVHTTHLMVTVTYQGPPKGAKCYLDLSIGQCVTECMVSKKLS